MGFQGEPGPEGAAGIPGIPGEDGAVGPKVSCGCDWSNVCLTLSTPSYESFSVGSVLTSSLKGIFISS